MKVAGGEFGGSHFFVWKRHSCKWRIYQDLVTIAHTAHEQATNKSIKRGAKREVKRERWRERGGERQSFI